MSPVSKLKKISSWRDWGHDEDKRRWCLQSIVLSGQRLLKGVSTPAKQRRNLWSVFWKRRGYFDLSFNAAKTGWSWYWASAKGWTWFILFKFPCSEDHNPHQDYGVNSKSFSKRGICCSLNVNAILIARFDFFVCTKKPGSKIRVYE